MKHRPPDRDDPTSEEEALEFDGAPTDRLDDSYRFRLVAACENPSATVRFNPRDSARPVDSGGSDGSATDKQLKTLDRSVSKARTEPTQQPDTSRNR